jgi:hypothetical protein
MTEYELNYLLWGTTSIFHNTGLSIYQLQGDYIPRHSLEFLPLSPNFEKAHLTAFEDRLQFSNITIMESLLQDAVTTANKYICSIARQGVLFSHKNLIHDMQPHIHRQGYSTNPCPCLTVHYRIGNGENTEFIYWDPISQEDAIKNDLCSRTSIVDWCNQKQSKILNLKDKKNIILFNSGLVPHRISHTNDLNIYFIFDHVYLKDQLLQNTLLPVILHE